MSYDNYHFRSEAELKSSGYAPLAGPYYRKDEWMLDNLLEDAKRATRDVAFSGDRTCVEVWQKPTTA